MEEKMEIEKIEKIEKPIVVFCGPTGVGKSAVVERLSKGEVKGISSDGKKGYTNHVTRFDLSIASAYDTPGLGDSDGRDQVFIHSMVDTLVRENSGIHRLYFCIEGDRARVDTLIQTSLIIINDIFGKPDMNLVKVVCTKMDKCADDVVALEQWTTVIREFCTLKGFKGIPKLIPVAENRKNRQGYDMYPQGDKALIDDIKSCDLKQVIQTQFMQKVATIETKVLMLNKEAEASRQAAEKAKQERDRLATELLHAKSDQDKLIIQTEIMKADAKRFEEAQKAWEQEKEIERQERQKSEEQLKILQGLAESQQRSLTVLEEIAKRPPAEPTVVHNHHYHDDDDDDGGCSIL